MFIRDIISLFANTGSFISSDSRRIRYDCRYFSGCKPPADVEVWDFEAAGSTPAIPTNENSTQLKFSFIKYTFNVYPPLKVHISPNDFMIGVSYLYSLYIFGSVYYSFNQQTLSLAEGRILTPTDSCESVYILSQSTKRYTHLTRRLVDTNIGY